MLVIVRHGNTFSPGETPRRIGKRTDLPLTGQGEAQARALGAHFANAGWHFARAMVSPLLRTRQTASFILASQSHPAVMETIDFLCEIDHGPDENRTESEVLERIGADAVAEWDSTAVSPPGWHVDADNRIKAWKVLLAELAADQPPILLVTSNGAARFALLAMDDAPAHDLKLPTGSYGIIRRSAQGALVVPVWGQRP